MAVGKRVEDHRSFADQFRAAVQEGLRASKTLRGITGLHVIEQKASVSTARLRNIGDDIESTFSFRGISPNKGTLRS